MKPAEYQNNHQYDSTQHQETASDEPTWENTGTTVASPGG